MLKGDKILFCIVLASVAVLSFISQALAGTLSCVVRTSSCSGGEVAVLRMSSTTNAHAELASQSSYDQLVCCGGVTGLDNLCTGNFGTLLKLSDITNAHAEQNSYSNYADSACLSVPPGDSISVNYQDTNCDGYDATIASMSGGTNAHVGDGSVYATKVCATANNTIISVSVSDGTVTYGTKQANATDNTVNLTDTQTATNNGNVTEIFNIKGQDGSGGGCAWELKSANGTDQYVHEFSINGGTLWTPLATSSYQELVPSVASSSSQTFDLKITTPTDSSCFGEQSVNVTVQAIQA